MTRPDTARLRLPKSAGAVALALTCLDRLVFPRTAVACRDLLRRHGIEADIPANQPCCGQMHFNSGYHDDALALARRQVKALARYRLVVCPSASCTGMMRDSYPHLARAAGGAEFAASAHDLASRTFELTEFMNRLDPSGVVEPTAHRTRVAYHPTCHSLRVLRLGDGPEQLLRRNPNIELVELRRSDECCGFGGTFAVKNANTSAAIVLDKVEAVIESGCDVVTGVDNSCLMQIGGALSRARSRVRAVHIAELLQ